MVLFTVQVEGCGDQIYFHAEDEAQQLCDDMNSCDTWGLLRFVVMVPYSKDKAPFIGKRPVRGKKD